jgi:4'-phosphopantetheinyl transferase
MSVSDLMYPGNVAARPRALPQPTALVALWWCDLAPGFDAVDELGGWLSPAEHLRAARFASPERRARYVAGRAALRWTLAQRLGIEPREVPIERGERGRPRLAGSALPDFNVSNTRDVALIALCDTPHVRVGVDVEHVERPVRHEGLARKFLTARERETIADLDQAGRSRAFLRYWTFKEAMSKATGEALGAPLRRIEVAPGPPSRLVAGPAPYEPGAWELHEAHVPSGYLAAVALWRRRL